MRIAALGCNNPALGPKGGSNIPFRGSREDAGDSAGVAKLLIKMKGLRRITARPERCISELASWICRMRRYDGYYGEACESEASLEGNVEGSKRSLQGYVLVNSE